MRWLTGLMLVSTACAPAGRMAEGPTTPTAPAARPLAYGTPPTPTMTYEFSDSSGFDIQAGPAGSIKVNRAVKGTAQLAFEQASGGQKVTLTITDMAGSFTNSAGGGTTSATSADIKGPAILTISPRGVVTIDQRPELTQAFRSVAGSDNVLRRFFIRLPGRVVQPGATWTDTLVAEETDEGLTNRIEDVIHSTYARDTTVAGQRLQVITSETARSFVVRGTTQGVEIVQRLSGPATAVTLWDPEQRALVSRSESVQLNGTMDLPAMGMTNMPITSSGKATLQRK